jgi:hypothetical protein
VSDSVSLVGHCLAVAAITNVIAGGLLALWLRRQAGDIVFKGNHGNCAATPRAAGDGP